MSTYCVSNMTNATNASNVVCIMNNKTNNQFPEYLPEYNYSMDISIFSYMYTLFLAFGCYSFLNPVAARQLLLNILINLAKYTITGYGLFKEHIYKPYTKHVHPKLLRLLHIDDGINEIVVIKNGKIIHSFKTMELFVKNNPIKFVKEFSDDGDIEEEEEEEEEEEDEQQKEQQECINQDNINLTDNLSDKVDYNKKCEQINDLIEAFKLHSLNSKPCQSISSDTEDTDNTPDDYILDPTAYDFIIRNFYYQNEKTGETHSYVFKYDIFYKSEMHEKYDVDMVKDNYVSNRKFIGISLKTNNLKYNINLTSPNNYYISDNSILNYSFMKWYMMKHYYVKLSNEYIISCIDNYVEMYKINPGKKIFVHNNRFELVDDETFVVGDVYTDNHGDVESESEESHSHSESESTTSDEHSSTHTKNDSSKKVTTNLEETHEMCDIEILDCD